MPVANPHDVHFTDCPSLCSLLTLEKVIASLTSDSKQLSVLPRGWRHSCMQC